MAKIVLSVPMRSSKTGKQATRKIEAYTCGVPGLVIVKGYKFWNITHKASGAKLPGSALFTSIAKAQRAAQGLAQAYSFINWEHSPDKIKEAFWARYGTAEPWDTVSVYLNAFR